jgi:DNA-binding beta-propeller fold protein YncE
MDTSGNVYVADLSDRIQKFDANGTFLMQWGSLGSGAGQFDEPLGLATDASGNLYVSDLGNGRIQKFDSSGTFLLQWGSPGSGDGEFTSPIGVAIDDAGNVYVADSDNFSAHYRIQKFDSSGNFLLKWGSSGSGDGQFDGLQGIAVDPSGNVYVADLWNHRIQKFDANGNFLTKWGSPGSGDGQFVLPRGLATDSSGNLYVADFGNDRIQQFDANGTLLAKWGTLGGGSGQFNGPGWVAVAGSGNVYVADQYNSRIQLFGTAPFTLTTDRDQLSAGDTATLRTFAGEPSKPALLLVTAVNGSPFFLPVLTGSLDGNGTWTLSAPVPTVSPATFTLRTFSFDALNNIIQTNDQDLTIN